MDKLKELENKLSKAQADMGQVLEQAGDNLDFKKVTCVSGTDEEKAAAFRKMNDECGKAMKELNDHRATLKAREEFEGRKAIAGVHQPGPSTKEKEGGRKLKEYFGEEPKALMFGDAMYAVKAVLDERGIQKSLKEIFSRHDGVELDHGVNLKTLFETGAGWAPETTRTGRVIDKAVRPIQVTDLIPAGQTGQSAVVYMEETTFDDSLVVEKAEGVEYGEAAFALTERSETVRKIPAIIPVTDEQLEDVPQARGYLNNRLPFALRRRLDNQIVNGSGVSPNLTGILNKSGIATHVRSSVAGDKPVDGLRRAMTKVRVDGRAVPNGIILNAYDWEGIRLMKTNDGAYIWGHPAESGPVQIWGLPVAENDVIAEGTAIVADFMFSELAERRGIVVKISDSHSDYFAKGKQAIRADMRVAFVIYRAAAFCKVTL